MAIDINTTQNSTFIPDTNLREIPPADLSAIQAQIQGLAQQVSSYVAGFKSAQEQAQKMFPEQKPEQADVPAEKGGLDYLKGLASKIFVQPQKTTQQYMVEVPELRKQWLESQGFTQKKLDEGQRVSGELQNLSAQSSALKLQEQAELAQISAAFGIRGRKGAMENEIRRKYMIEQSNLGAQMAIKMGEYNITQGRIDQAKADFDKALNYATAKERTAVEDFRWALGFYMDIDKTQRDILQRELDNKIKQEEIARDEKWKQLNYQLELAKFTKKDEVDVIPWSIQAARMGLVGLTKEQGADLLSPAMTTPPEWFKQQIERQHQKLFTKENLQEQWDIARKTVQGKEKQPISQSVLNRLSVYGVNEQMALAIQDALLKNTPEAVKAGLIKDLGEEQGNKIWNVYSKEVGIDPLQRMIEDQVWGILGGFDNW